MVDNSLWVTLKLDIIPEQTGAYEAFFAAMQAKVAAEEPGTLRFEMYRVKDTPCRYMMIEQYADQAAWDFHSAKQGERGVVPAMMQFAAGPPEFQFLENIG